MNEPGDIVADVSNGDPANSGGYVLVHRKLLESHVFANADLLRLFLWCLLRASYTRRHVPVSTGRGSTVVELRPGQFIYGRKQSAQDLNVAESTLRDQMKRLQRLAMIDIQPATHFSLVTVVNWDTYQRPPAIERQASRHASDSQPTTNRQPTTTNNKGKKVNQVNQNSHTQAGGARKQVPLRGDLDTPEVATLWNGFLETSFRSSGVWPGEPTQDVWLMTLAKRGLDKAKLDLEFSIGKQAKTLLDSDNDFQKQRGTNGHKPPLNAADLL